MTEESASHAAPHRPRGDGLAARPGPAIDAPANSRGGESPQRWCFEFSIEGDLRFISHHDMLRMFQRALARADLPVRYSQGFNPHASVSLPLPRPVGLASDAEAVVIVFDGEADADTILARLASQMPGGLILRAARRLEQGEKLHPDRVRYRIETDGIAPPDIDRRIRELLDAAAAPMERKEAKTGRTRTVDVRPYIDTIERRGSVIEMALRVADTVRPAELAERLGMDARAAVARKRRREIQRRTTSER
jgi:radical SAM-linked protein